ncbi:hypothetical protein [Paraburkholderia sp. J12]|nr:hypothetical protein [Paraburkholderia sp. J12]
MAVFGPDVTLHQSAFVHDTTHLYGKMTVHENAFFWIDVVARA